MPLAMAMAMLVSASLIALLEAAPYGPSIMTRKDLDTGFLLLRIRRLCNCLVKSLSGRRMKDMSGAEVGS
jgi:hypothetical protein